MKAGAHDYLMKGNLNRLAPAIERELREAANRRERREARAKLLESELRYRLLWESSPDAVLLMDSESKILFGNPAVETVFGYNQEEVDWPTFGQAVARGLAQQRCARHRELFAHRRQGEHAPRRRDGGTAEGRAGDRDRDQFQPHGNARRAASCGIRARHHGAQENRARAAGKPGAIAGGARDSAAALSKIAPALDGFDIAGVTYPAEETGGDYFDYLPMMNGALGVIVADVTGHGIGPALLMAETRAYLRTLAANREDIGEILTTANRILAEDVGEERYVTLFLGRIDPKTRDILLRERGPSHGLRAGPGGEIKSLLKRTSVPLGINPNAKFDGAVKVSLQSGDIVLLLTDGIEEAMAPDESFFGIERTLNVVRQNRDKPAREILDALYRAVRDFSQQTPQLDDVTAIVIKVV